MPIPKPSAPKTAAAKTAKGKAVAAKAARSRATRAAENDEAETSFKVPKMSKRTEEEALAAAKTDSDAQRYIMAPNGIYKLYLTDVPGEYINPVGTRVDHRNCAISILSLGKKLAEERERRILGGKLAETPAEVLKVAAMDRDMPLAFRVDAAAKAAPYFDRKMPQAIDGGANPSDPGGPGLPINISDLKGLSTAELAQLKALLTKAKPVTQT